MARPKKFDAQRVTKAIRISPELDEKLKQIASEREVAVNLVITWALERFVEEAQSVEELKRMR